MVLNSTLFHQLCRETHFEFPTLTPIHGEPTANTLIPLRKQLKSNAKSVPSNLGGGNFGHFGLVIPPNCYNLISNVSFICPNHPGHLVIPPGMAQHAAATMRDQHAEQMHVFKEVNVIDQVLIQQIIQAVESDFLSASHDCTTNSINLPVFDVLDYLGNTYGNVTEEMLHECEDGVTCMSYSLSQPIDIIFNALDNLADKMLDLVRNHKILHLADFVNITFFFQKNQERNESVGMYKTEDIRF